MTDVIVFSVRGEPVPQGSTRAFVVKGHAVTTSANPKTKGWRQSVSLVATQHAPAELWEGPVNVELLFRMGRPPSVSLKKRPLPTTKPDLDKLIRAILDALTAVVWKDDSQVTGIVASKHYDDGAAPGVDVTVRRL